MIRPSESITVTGRLSSDPADLKDKSGEVIGLKFSVPVGHGYKNKETGEWCDTGTTWYEVAVFREAADSLRNAGLYKGQFVRVQSNEVKPETWTDKDGKARVRLNLKIWDGDVAVVLHKPKEDSGYKTYSQQGTSGDSPPASLRDELPEQDGQAEIDFDSPPTGDAEIPF